MVNRIESSNIMDLVKIKDSIGGGGNPIGVGVTLGVYDQIRNTRPYKDPKNPLNTWQNVLDLSVEALKTSKDLNVCCWILEALTYEEQLAGFSVGLEIINQLLNIYPACYPIVEDDKANAINWVDENMITWFENQEIFNKATFQTLYQDIFSGKITKELVKKYPYDGKFIENKLNLIAKTKKTLENMGYYGQIMKNTCSFLQKLENFYTNYKKFIVEYYSKPDASSPENTIIINGSISKNELYNSLLETTKRGLDDDKNDLLLFMIYKIILLRGKTNNEIFKIIRDNNLNTLLY
jgi:hypothetical protein